MLGHSAMLVTVCLDRVLHQELVVSDNVSCTYYVGKA